MRRNVRLRTLPLSPHPPYGLFVDPHAGTHSWFLVDSRVLVAMLGILAGVIAVLNGAAR